MVKMNAITVPEGMGEEREARFAARVGEVDGVEGFRRARVAGAGGWRDPLLRV